MNWKRLADLDESPFRKIIFQQNILCVSEIARFSADQMNRCFMPN